ncbi:MAG TPA: S4 domain-containing protein, partial [Candidatus Angelobacter sp.]|nr:S4 domain-containing protein [Candidatus Angelobacter sp.]
LYEPIPDREVLKLAGDRVRWVRLDKLLFEAKLTSSKSEASRKIKEGAVKIGQKQIPAKVTSLVLEVPSEMVISLGRKVCRIQIIL